MELLRRCSRASPSSPNVSCLETLALSPLLIQAAALEAMSDADFVKFEQDSRDFPAETEDKKYNTRMRLLMGQWRSIAKEVMEHTAIIAKFLCLLHIVDTHVITTTQVYGPSMLPTLNLSGDVLLTERISAKIGKVGIGDVVLVKSPENPKRIVTKRILGMEGDKVTYLVDPRRSERARTIVVPKGHIWIQGDNMYSSRDSRDLGPVPYGLLQGKVFCRVWPPRDFGFLNR